MSRKFLKANVYASAVVLAVAVTPGMAVWAVFWLLMNSHLLLRDVSS